MRGSAGAQAVFSPHGESGIGTMTFDRHMWIGLMVIALGWALLFSAPELLAFLPNATAWPNAHIEMAATAGCMILSGFGLTLLSALQMGFDTLKRCIESGHGRAGHAPAKGHSTTQPKTIVERGRIKDRAFVLYLDGTVEIETMLGRRIFSSLQEAQEFIA